MGFRTEQIAEGWVAFQMEPGEWGGAEMIAWRDFFARMLSECKEALAERAVWEMCSKIRAPLIVQNLINVAGHLQCVFWDWPIFQAAIAGSEAFAGQEFTGGDVPELPEMWLYGDSLTLTPKAREIMQIPLQATQIATIILQSKGIASPNGEPLSPDNFEFTGRRGITVCDVFLPDPASVDLERGEFACAPYLRAWPAIYCGDRVPMSPYVSTIAARRFMEQPFVAVERAGGTRQWRRSYERQHGKEPPVKTVVLRRKQKGEEAGSEANGSGHGAVDWSCQWLVKGHWRKRSERYGPGEPGYVRPYLKGPEDKPFRAPKPVVYKVKR